MEVMKNHGDFTASQIPPLLLCILKERFPIKKDISSGYFTASGKKP